MSAARAAPGRAAAQQASPRGEGQRQFARRVSELQRARMLDAATAVIAERGYPNMTVAHLIDRARVSRTTFYDAFASREDCFLAVFEYAWERSAASAQAAYETETGWSAGLSAALASLLLLIEDEPQLARVCLLDSLAAGERMRARRAAALRQVVPVIDRGRAVGRSDAPSPLTAEALVGGVVGILQSRLLCGEREFVGLLGPLMAVLVLPYLGAGSARRELRRDRPLGERAAAVAPALPAPPERRRLGSREARVTYRTLRVLTAVAERPGVSNRKVAERSGISDPGQASKLLSRLARSGLVENLGAGAPGGTANAWRITRRGAELRASTLPMLASRTSA